MPAEPIQGRGAGCPGRRPSGAPRRSDQGRAAPGRRARPGPGRGRRGRRRSPAPHRAPPGARGRSGAWSRAGGSGWRRRLLRRRHQRLVDQARQQVQDVPGARPSRRRAHLLGRLERPAAGEHRQAGEQALLGRRQVVAPVHRRPQRLVAREGGAAAPGQEAEPVVEPRRSSPPAASRPVRPPARGPGGCRPAGAHLGHRRGVASVRRKSGCTGARAVEEQVHGRVPAPGRRRPRRRADARPARVAGTGRDGTRQTVSPATPSGWRLVARMRRSGHARSRARPGGRTRACARSCPARAARGGTQRVRVAVRAGRPGCSRRPSAAAPPGARGRVGQRRQLRRPDPVGPAAPPRVRRRCRARRVLPTPPVPVSVTSRVRRPAGASHLGDAARARRSW